MLIDAAVEAWQSLRGRWTRSLLTAAGIAVGLLTVTATAGITATLQAQVSARFDARVATTVVVSGYAPPRPGRPEARWGDPMARVRALNGVRYAGRVAAAGGEGIEVRRSTRIREVTDASIGLLAMEPQALAAYDVYAVRGRLFDAGHERRRDAVALVGSAVAPALGLDDLDQPARIALGSMELLVIGVVTSPDPSAAVDLSVVVPYGVATAGTPTTDGLQFGADTVVLRTDLGAAAQVGREAPLALAPTDPGSLTAQVPPDPRTLRRDVEGDTRTVVLLLAVTTLLVGALGISNTMLVSVLERRHEIGVRRTVGAGAHHILAQILLEATILGVVGGTIGALLGVNVANLTALAQGWTAVVPPWTLTAGPVLGAGVGLLAGVYPATKALRIQPVAALNG